MKISLKVMLIVAAVYWVFNGLLALVAPLSVFRVTRDASTPMILVMGLRFWGVGNLGLGAIAWLARNAGTSKARDAVVQGSIFFFILQAVVSVYAEFMDPGGPHVPFAVIEALIGIALFLAYRSSRAESGS